MIRFVKRQGIESREPLLAELPPWQNELLRLRGISTPEEAEAFLHPGPSMLHDPFLMADMEKAVSIIRRAISQNKPMVIYGDYDVDGMGAIAILMESLAELGADVAYYIPSRHDEGYGLNEAAIRKLAQTYRLLITVDCGITNIDEVALARELGMEVIVTDHHQLGDVPCPGDAVLNPLLGDYPFGRLCGAGVAAKLVMALGGMALLKPRLDIAALSTIADIVPLLDENRVLAALGLRAMTHTTRPGLRALMDITGVTGDDPQRPRPVRAGQVAYLLAPRLNAAGRLSDAALGVELLTTTEAQRGQELAALLHEENAKRQQLEGELLREACAMAESTVDFPRDRAVVVEGENWNSGVIGLVASRLAERYHYPTVVLSRQGDLCVGSARSIPGVNIHAMLSECKDLFTRFGGHEQAAGLTLPAAMVSAFRARLNKALLEHSDPLAYIPSKEYDVPLSLGELTTHLVAALEGMQPTGCGNPDPVFLLREATIQDMRTVGKTGEHLKLTFSQGDAVREGIAFRMGEMAPTLPQTVDVLFSPEINTYGGRQQVQCQVKALAPTGGEGQLKPFEGQDVLLPIARDILWLMTREGQAANGEQAAQGVLPQALDGAQGILVLCRTLETAKAALSRYGSSMDVALGQAASLQGFHTLLFAPRAELLSDSWHTIYLADGLLLPGEAEAIAGRCPHARVILCEKTPALNEALSLLAMEDEPLRNLYRALRAMVNPTLAQLAKGSGLSTGQALVGLHAFSELSLITLEDTPFRCTLLPAKKCAMEDSALIRKLRSL